MKRSTLLRAILLVGLILLSGVYAADETSEEDNTEDVPCGGARLSFIFFLFLSFFCSLSLFVYMLQNDVIVWYECSMHNG